MIWLKKGRGADVDCIATDRQTLTPHNGLLTTDNERIERQLNGYIFSKTSIPSKCKPFFNTAAVAWISASLASTSCSFSAWIT